MHPSWYATDGTYRQLKRWQRNRLRKNEDKTLTIESFCKNGGSAEGINHSVMQCFLGNDGRRERSGQGQPYNCDALLNQTSTKIMQGRLETHAVISSVMKWFRFESEKRFNENM